MEVSLKPYVEVTRAPAPEETAYLDPICYCRPLNSPPPESGKRERKDYLSAPSSVAAIARSSVGVDGS
ncbi:hypothetical protein J6590_058459 [Homalodisca vitripennis]|nr:hypothetical protein J6590_058459 [Homalodisca vitripennis]